MGSLHRISAKLVKQKQNDQVVSKEDHYVLHKNERFKDIISKEHTFLRMHYYLTTSSCPLLQPNKTEASSLHGKNYVASMNSERIGLYYTCGVLKVEDQVETTIPIGESI